MAIIYDDINKSQFQGRGNIADWDPLKPYLKHYDNLLYLTFIANNSDNRVEKHQAAKEILICERKLAFWKRHPKWNATEAATAINKLKSKWESKRS